MDGFITTAGALIAQGLSPLSAQYMIAALASTPASLRWQTLLLMPFAGRCSMVMQLALLPYARSGGLCSLFVQNGRRSDVVVTLVALAAVGWLVGGHFGLCVAGVSVAAIAIFSLWCRSRIGGFTGDTLGAGCEWVELIPAVVAAAWLVK